MALVVYTLLVAVDVPMFIVGTINSTDPVMVPVAAVGAKYAPPYVVDIWKDVLETMFCT